MHVDVDTRTLGVVPVRGPRRRHNVAVEDGDGRGRVDVEHRAEELGVQALELLVVLGVATYEGDLHVRCT